MKLFILTHCAAEENYTPRVFKTYEEAKKEMDQTVNDFAYEKDNDGEILFQYADNIEIYNNGAEIIYGDDTYDRFDIFEIELE